MTRREKLERRAERRREWAEGREQKSANDFNRARAATDGIPLGQPILIGHHSERHHRRAIERSDNAMRRAVESNKMAETHRQKAAGIEANLERSVFSDDEDAIEKLEERIAKREQERERNNAINRIVRAKPRAVLTESKIERLTSEAGVSEATAQKLFEPDCCGNIGIPSYVNQNLSGNIRSDKLRLEQIKARQIIAERAESSEDGYIVDHHGGGYSSIAFAEKPPRETLNELKNNGFRWSGGRWIGKTADMPDHYK